MQHGGEVGRVVHALDALATGAAAQPCEVRGDAQAQVLPLCVVGALETKQRPTQF